MANPRLTTEYSRPLRLKQTEPFNAEMCRRSFLVAAVMNSFSDNRQGNPPILSGVLP